MKFLKLITLALLLSLLSACNSLPSKFEKPQVNLAGIQIEELGLFEQKFVLSLRVSNPNDISLPMNGLKVQVDVNEKPFATGVSNQKITLPSLGEAMVKLNVTTNLSGILKQLKTLQNQPLRYTVSGTLFVPLVPGGVPFDRKGELPGFDKLLTTK